MNQEKKQPMSDGIVLCCDWLRILVEVSVIKLDVRSRTLLIWIAQSSWFLPVASNIATIDNLQQVPAYQKHSVSSIRPV